jgi:hypothetical protein
MVRAKKRFNESFTESKERKKRRNIERKKKSENKYWMENGKVNG